MSVPQPVRRPARVDASMDLLREAAERSLDPSYAAAAAARRDREGSGAALPRSTRRRRAVLSGVLALVLGVAVTGAVGQLRAPAPPEVRSELLSQIDDRTAQVEALQEQVTSLRSEVDAQQDALLGGSGDAAVEQAGEWEVEAGLTPVTGPGLSITLDDPVTAGGDGVGTDPRAGTTDAESVVLDVDLQEVTNQLWASGAEAIAINGERVTAKTAIRRAGEAILVNFTPLSPPYVVEAIGGSQEMANSFRASPTAVYLDNLQERIGLRVSSSTHDDLSLPADNSAVLNYATVPAGAAAAAERSTAAAADRTTAPDPGATTQEDPSP